MLTEGTRSPAIREAAAWGALALVSRLVFAARFPTEWDSAQLVLAVDNFDVRMDSPHPPGYWLYVFSGRVLTTVSPLEAVDALAVVAALGSAATIAVLYVLGRELAGPWAGRAAAALLLSSPFAWFYGSIVNTYIFDPLAATILMLVAWRAYPGSVHGFVAAATLGVAAGFRQTALVTLAPLAFVAVVRSSHCLRRWVAVAAVGAAALALWAVPMAVEQPGGLAVLRAENAEQTEGVMAATSILGGATQAEVRDNALHAVAYTSAATLPMLLVWFVGVAGSVRSRRLPAPSRGSLTPLRLALVGLLPPLLFVLLVSFAKAGYVMAFLPALTLALLLPGARLTGRWRVAATVAVAAGCLFSAHRFIVGEGVLPLRLVDEGNVWLTDSRFGAPYLVTRREIDRVDDESRQYSALEAAFDPERDVLVYAWLNGGHRFRHATLLYPGFRTHLIVNGVHRRVSQDGTLSLRCDRQIDVPDGGRAVLVLDFPPEDLQRLVDEGDAERVRLSTGPVVYVVESGNDVLGVGLGEGRSRPAGRTSVDCTE